MKKITKTWLSVALVMFVMTPQSALGQNTAPLNLLSLESLQNDRRIYLLDSFAMGTVFKKNGSAAHAMLNYNLLSQRMQFIHDGEVLDLVTPQQEINYMRADIETYISENRTDFTNLQDLTAITLHFNP
ncbi:MAG: hypothetical protein FWC94_06085 [Bacteroidales bacterium]|nr:hypothetical protein [Bacteroidales bacterium]